MAFNTIADVREVLHLDSGNKYLADAEITSFLNRSSNDLFSSLGRKYEYDKIRIGLDPKGNKVTRFFLAVKPIVSIFRVIVNGSEISNLTYSLDADTDELIFTDTSVIATGDTMEVYYLPQAYHSAELYLTCANILLTTNLVSEGGVSKTVYEDVMNQRDSFMKSITSRLIVTEWV